MAGGHRGDHAVDKATRGDTGSPAAAIDARGRMEVGRDIEAKKVEAQEQAMEVHCSLIGPGPGQNLHDDRISDGEGTVFTDDVVEAQVDLAARSPVVLDPC